jgi:hypothetical protein
MNAMNKEKGFTLIELLYTNANTTPSNKTITNGCFSVKPSPMEPFLFYVHF